MSTLKSFMLSMSLGLLFTTGVVMVMPANAALVSLTCGSGCNQKSDCQGCCDKACCPQGDSCDNSGNQACYATCPITAPAQ